MTDIPDSYVEAVRGNVCPTVEEQIKADCTAAIADLESRLAATRDELARSYERAGHGAPVPDDLREVVCKAAADTIQRYWEDDSIEHDPWAISNAVLCDLTAAGYVVSRLSPEEPKTPPEPVYNAVERILDERERVAAEAAASNLRAVIDRMVFNDQRSAMAMADHYWPYDEKDGRTDV